MGETWVVSVAVIAEVASVIIAGGEILVMGNLTEIVIF